MTFTNVALALLGAAGPVWIAWLMYRRSERMAARAEYLESALERRRKAAELKATIAAEEAAAKADVEAKHTAKMEAVAQERSTVEDAMRKRGTAKAASEHVKRMRNIAKLVLFCFASWAADVRAEPEPCTEGVSLIAGDRIDCDAECLPEDELDWLLKRSIKLIELETELEREKGLHVATLKAAGQRYDQCLSDYLDLEKSCQDKVTATADSISPSTYVLIAVGIFFVGAAAGAGAYHALRN